MYPTIEMGFCVTSALWMRLRRSWMAPKMVYPSPVFLGFVAKVGTPGRLAFLPLYAGCGLYGSSFVLQPERDARRAASTDDDTRRVCMGQRSSTGPFRPTSGHPGPGTLGDVRVMVRVAAPHPSSRG